MYEKRKSIAIIVPESARGGVKTIINKVIEGLKIEGFHVQSYIYPPKVINSFVYDIRNIRRLSNYDAILYAGSIPWFSQLFVKYHTKILLFIHGYVRHELSNRIKEGNFQEKLSAMLSFIRWTLLANSNFVHKFICNSISTCEGNVIFENYILLPQFIFPYEVEVYEEYAKEIREQEKEQRNTIRILAYTSSARSPRLLKIQHIIYLAKKVSKHINKNIEMIIVDPHQKNEVFKTFNNLIVKIIKSLPRTEFLKYVANSDIFMETNIDEELRMVSIEAALLLTPIAKFTHPLFKDRCDYGNYDLLHAYSFDELIKKIIEYVSNKEYYSNYYSRNMINFLLKHRTWDKAKDSLIKTLLETDGK
jgi:hypothetical protein